MRLIRLAIENPYRVWSFLVRQAKVLPRKFILKALFPARINPAEMKTFLWNILPVKTKARHQEITLLSSIDTRSDLPKELLNFAVKAVETAQTIHLNLLEERAMANPFAASVMKESGYYFNTWPGEHYRLLTSLAMARGAETIVEIGTFHGASALAFKEGVALDSGRVVTFDIVPWNNFEQTLLRKQDFDDKLTQIVGDLQDPIFFNQHRDLFEKADLIFMDAAKDGIMERIFVNSFSQLNYKKSPVLIIDDIHLWNMLDIWEEIMMPKLDITCFGHYTGTGLVLL